MIDISHSFGRKNINHYLLSKAKTSTLSGFKASIIAWGGTGIYGLYRYVPMWRVWFSSSLLLDRVYKSESLGLEEGIVFLFKLINWMKILV